MSRDNIVPHILSLLTFVLFFVMKYLLRLNNFSRKLVIDAIKGSVAAKTFVVCEYSLPFT